MKKVLDATKMRVPRDCILITPMSSCLTHEACLTLFLYHTHVKARVVRVVLGSGVGSR